MVSHCSKYYMRKLTCFFGKFKVLNNYFLDDVHYILIKKLMRFIAVSKTEGPDNYKDLLLPCQGGVIRNYNEKD